MQCTCVTASRTDYGESLVLRVSIDVTVVKRRIYLWSECMGCHGLIVTLSSCITMRTTARLDISPGLLWKLHKFGSYPAVTTEEGIFYKCQSVTAKYQCWHRSCGRHTGMQERVELLLKQHRMSRDHVKSVLQVGLCSSH